jgi:hypothetical protein
MTTIMKFIEWQCCVYAQDPKCQKLILQMMQCSPNGWYKVVQYMDLEGCFEPDLRIVK